MESTKIPALLSELGLSSRVMCVNHERIGNPRPGTQCRCCNGSNSDLYRCWYVEPDSSHSVLLVICGDCLVESLLYAIR